MLGTYKGIDIGTEQSDEQRSSLKQSQEMKKKEDLGEFVATSTAIQERLRANVRNSYAVTALVDQNRLVSSQRPQGLDEERDFTHGPTGTQPVLCPECRFPFRLGDHPTPAQCPNCLCWFCCHVCRAKHNRRGWCGPGDSLGMFTDHPGLWVSLDPHPGGTPRWRTWATCPACGIHPQSPENASGDKGLGD